MTDLDTGPITDEEARQILSRFNASHFRLHDKEHARYSIPADPRRDDDIRLGAYIDQTEKLRADLLAAVRKVERVEALAAAWRKTVDAPRRPCFGYEPDIGGIQLETLEGAAEELEQALSAPPAQVGTDEEAK